MKHLGLALLATLVALLGVELGLRVVPASLWKNAVRFDAPYLWQMYDPILGWKNRPLYSQPEFRINALGFRGADITSRKPPGTIRIICVGDSRTFGTWLDLGRIRYDNDYASPLEALVRRATSKNVEVINAGVIGYASAHGLRQFITQLVNLEPDVVVVGLGFNDHSLAWSEGLRCLEPHNPLAHALMYELADVQTFQLGLRVSQGVLAFRTPPFTHPWVEPEEYAYNLHRFGVVATEHGAHLMLLTQTLRAMELGDSKQAFPAFNQPPPDSYTLYGGKDLADLHRVESLYRDRLYSVARTDGIAVADAAAAFASHQGEPLFGEYDLVHPNPAGARVIAETIYAQLIQLDWLVGAPPSRSVVSPVPR